MCFLDIAAATSVFSLFQSQRVRKLQRLCTFDLLIPINAASFSYVKTFANVCFNACSLSFHIVTDYITATLAGYHPGKGPLGYTRLSYCCCLNPSAG